MNSYENARLNGPGRNPIKRQKTVENRKGAPTATPPRFFDSRPIKDTKNSGIWTNDQSNGEAAGVMILHPRAYRRSIWQRRNYVNISAAWRRKVPHIANGMSVVGGEGNMNERRRETPPFFMPKYKRNITLKKSYIRTLYANYMCNRMCLELISAYILLINSILCWYMKNYYICANSDRKIPVIRFENDRR